MRHLEPGKFKYRIRIKGREYVFGFVCFSDGDGGLREKMVS